MAGNKGGSTLLTPPDSIKEDLANVDQEKGVVEELVAQEAPKKPQYQDVWCKYLYNPDELRDIAETLAIKTQDLEAKEEEKKSVMAEFTAMVKDISGEIKKAATLYKDGYQMRNLECEVVRDFETGVVFYFRTDNGEIAKQTKMTMAEKQRTIDQELERLEKEGEMVVGKS